MPSCPWLWQLSDLRVGGGRLHLDRLELLPGITVITGPSGAGKSTLLGVLTGFVATGAGRVERAPAGDRLPVFWASGGLALWQECRRRSS
jgi:ABC-type taurine transport system ATPase subunit